MIKVGKMKKIIIAEYIYQDGKILKNHAIAFDTKICAVAPKSRILKEYKGAEVIQYPKNSLLFPGLINAHVHIEFSANKTTLDYGDFITWLYSVIENREDLMQKCQEKCMQQALDRMLERGITTIGAISSHGLDLGVCANAKQNVVFFNELIGSQAAAADVLFGDFMQRLENAQECQREGFYPAVAIHSPYSVHPILIQKALEVVKKQKLPLTAHFMESPAEREWIDNSAGEFKEFFEKFLNQSNAVTSAKEFLSHFDATPTLFAHGVEVSKEELQHLAQKNHTIIHCPISNRLLGNNLLDIKALNEAGVEWIVATDGLSSNYDLDLWEELKIALFAQTKLPLKSFAKALLDGVTKRAAKALNLQKGLLAQGYDADMIVLDLEGGLPDDVELHMILHQYPVIDRFILGKKG